MMGGLESWGGLGSRSRWDETCNGRRVPVASGARSKTNKRDAPKLAMLLAGGQP